MTVQEHTIHQQVYEIHFPNEEQAKQLTSLLEEFNSTTLLPAMDRVFNEICEPDETLFIERLEIDIGTIDASQFLNVISSQVEEFLNETILKRSFARIRDTEITSTRIFSEGYSGFEIDKEFKGIILSDAENDLICIQYFLLTGSLPWWISAPDFSIDEIVTRLIIEAKTKLHKILHRILSHGLVKRRLVSQSTDKTIQLIARLLYDDSKPLPDELIKEYPLLYKLAFQTLYTFEQFREVFWEIILSEYRLSDPIIILKHLFIAAHKPEVSSIKEIFISVKKKIDQISLSDEIAHTKVYILLKSFVDKALHLEKEMGEVTALEETETTDKKPDFDAKKKDIDSPIAEPTDIEGAEKDDKISPDTISGEVISIDSTEDILDREIESIDWEIMKELSIAEEDILTSELDTEIKELIKESAEKGFVISNAGLILLHPFLKTFFTTLDLVEGKEFFDRGSQERAIHILQYLATTSTSSPEYMLMLNKILCGLETSEPVKKQISISEREEEECNQLISSAIKHWAALKSTSVQGFRNSFLIRKGILRDSEKYWELTVERKGYDVLIDRIPWSISFIKLPWMAKGIYVEW